MKRNFFRIAVLILTLAALTCAFALMANAEVKTGKIYVSSCASDITPTGQSIIQAYGRAATIYLKKGAYETDEDGNLTATVDVSSPATKIVESTEEKTNPSKIWYLPCAFDVAGRELEESGLTYSYDTVSKVMTVSGKVRKMANGVDVPWVLPTPGVDAETSSAKPASDYSLVTKIVIEADTGVTRIYNHCLNGFAVATSVTIPDSVTTTECEGFGRMSKLDTIKVIGSEYDTGLDLRNITFFDPQTLHSISSSVTNLTIYLGDYLTNKKNAYNSSGTLASDAVLKNFGNVNFTGKTVTVYTTTGEPCDFARDIIMSRNTWSFVNGEYSTTQTDATKLQKYTIYVLPYSVCGVEPLGFRVRTTDYNGLRAEFERKAVGAKKYLITDEAGTGLLKTPTYENVSVDGTCVEFGVIVGTKTNIETNGYQLTKNGTTWTTAFEKIKKIAVDPADTSKFSNGRFCVTVINCDVKSQMEAQISYTGYEIWEDSNGNQTVVYAAQLAPTSLYDATLGVYEKGLINTGDTDYDVIWDVLDNFKIDMKAQMFEDGALKQDIQDYLKNVPLYSAANKQIYGCDGTDKNSAYKFRATDNGDLYWEGYEYTLVSFFEKSNGDYTCIVHLRKAEYDDYMQDNTKTKPFYGGGVAKNYKVENMLSTNYTGIPFKTIVIDDGISEIRNGALKGLGTWSMDCYTDAEATQSAKISYKGVLETIILPQTVTQLGQWTGSQALHTNYNLKTLYRVGDSQNGATEGLVDISFLDITADNEKFESETFNSCYSMVAVKLPSTNGYNIKLGSNFFMNCAALKELYVDGVEGNRIDGTTIDLTGTGYSIYDKSTFSTTSFFKIICSNGEIWERTAGTSWAWAKTN